VNPLRVGVGGTVYVNPAREAVPPGVVTEILPLAPVPTTAVILLGLLTLKDAAGTAPKATAVAPEKLAPFIWMVAPVVAELGVKELIIGTPVAR
jgi:hypothetical protein